MDTRNMMEEQEIDLLDFLWRFMEQWRGWIALALVFAVLLPGVMYVRSMRSYNAQVSAPAVSTESKSASAIVNDGASSDEVTSILITYARLTQALDYAEKSVLIKYAPKDLKQISLIYTIEAESYAGLVPMLQGQYCSLAGTDTLLSALGTAIGESDNPYLSELITVAPVVNQLGFGMETESKIASFAVNLTVPSSADISAVESAVNAVIKQASSDMKTDFGHHEVKFVRTQENVVDVSTIRTKQLDSYNSIVSYRAAFKKAYDALKDADKKKKIDELAGSEDLMADIEAFTLEAGKPQAEEKVVVTPAPAKPRLSKKYAAIGFILGIFIYGCCYLMYFILVRKMRREDELQDAINLRNFGGVYQYPYKGFGRFLHDKRIYRLRHKKAGSVEESVKRITDGLDSRVKYEKLSDVTFITLGNSDWAQARVNEWKSALSSSASVETLSFAKVSEELKNEALLSLKPVVLYITAGTSMSEIINILSRCRDYKIPVLGTVFMEG